MLLVLLTLALLASLSSISPSRDRTHPLLRPPVYEISTPGGPKQHERTAVSPPTGP